MRALHVDCTKPAIAPRRFACAVALGVLMLAWTGPAAAQHHHGGGGPQADPTATFGTVDLKNTCSAGVQKELLTAVAMLHSFAANPEQFTQVARKDPACAIAWWGAAMAQRWNPLAGEPDAETLKTGRGHVDRAKAAARGSTSALERGLIDTIDVYYRAYPAQDARTAAYEAAMEKVAADNPADAEITAFYGLSVVEAVDLTDRTYARQNKGGAILEKLLAQHPDHPGGLHYLIHAYDFAPLAERGLPAARRYAEVAPASSHAKHMPAHIFTMLGLWDESIRANRESNAVSSPQTANDPVGGDIADLHAYDFIAYARLQLGQDEKVRAALMKLRAEKRSDTILEARYALERGDWQAAVAVPRAPDSPFDDATACFTRALGAARLGDVAKAKTERRALIVLRESVQRSSGDYWAGYVDIYATATEAWIAKAEGRMQDAARAMAEAADRDDAREKHILLENKLLPMRELLGEFSLETGDPAAAFTAFTASLTRAPNRFRSYLGAARAAKAAQDQAVAREWYGKLLALAAIADARQAEIAEARAYLGQ